MTASAASRPLPPIPPNATRWTNARAEEAYRRGLAEGKQQGLAGASDRALRAAVAAVAPKPAPTG